MQYQRIVHEVTGVPLAIPQWAIDNRPAQVWTASEFELFAIKYREEAESFLSTAFNHRDAVYGSPKPSRREFKRQLVAYRAEQDPIPEEEEQEEKQGSYLPATLTSHHSAPIPTPSKEPPPPAVPQIEVQRGYVNNPARLSTSRRLSELVGNNLFSHVTSTPRGPGPDLSRQIPRQFQHRLHQSLQQPAPQYPIPREPPLIPTQSQQPSNPAEQYYPSGGGPPGRGPPGDGPPGRGPPGGGSPGRVTL